MTADISTHGGKTVSPLGDGAEQLFCGQIVQQPQEIPLALFGRHVVFSYNCVPNVCHSTRLLKKIPDQQPYAVQPIVQAGSETKNNHFIIKTCRQLFIGCGDNGFEREAVLFDSWLHTYFSPDLHYLVYSVAGTKDLEINTAIIC